MSTSKKNTAKAKKNTATKAAKVVAPVAKKVKTAAPAARVITTEVISARAFALWDQAGRPQGRDLDFWFQAENQLKQETQALAA